MRLVRFATGAALSPALARQQNGANASAGQGQDSGGAPSAAVCKQLIRANYAAPSDGADTVSFLIFEMSAPQPYEDVYAGDLPAPDARGHRASAAPVQSSFTVLTRDDDLRADGELRTYDARYMCFRNASGEWTVSMISRAPGGEAARYIHKG